MCRGYQCISFDNGTMSLVICSREADYKALSIRLKLQGAIRVQPLTTQPLNIYKMVFGGSIMTGIDPAQILAQKLSMLRLHAGRSRADADPDPVQREGPAGGARRRDRAARGEHPADVQLREHATRLHEAGDAAQLRRE